MPTYYSLITNNGLIKHADAASNSVKLDLSELAVGDSNGTHYDPDGSETALQNELHRVSLSHVVIDENNANQLVIEAVIDETVGPFYIREVGIFDTNGDLFAIGKYPETFKSDYELGSGKRIYIRMIIGFVNTPNVEIILSENINFDPNFSDNINNEINNRLKISQNLADLNNVEQARSNLNISDLTGAIMPFSFSLPPDGWLECNGAEISRITYANLFNKISTIYGSGDGINTFNIPDLRGEFIRGWDNGRGIDSGRLFATLQIDDFKSHQHQTFFNSAVSDGWGSGGRLNQGRDYHLTYDKSSNFVGGSETRPRNIAMNYCIRY